MSIVESFCGAYPDGFVKTDIASDPNYVFENDSDYGSVQLFNSEGSTIFVNSFTECEHYVTGGWEFTRIQTLEVSLQNYLLIFVIALIGLRFVMQKFKVI